MSVGQYGIYPAAGTGTAISVGLADGSTLPIYAITNSPVTTTGTLTFTLSTQAANKVFAGPTTGAAAQPTFRSLVSADIPSLAYANQSLSNLSATAINTDLLPAADVTQSLGDSAHRFSNAFINLIKDNLGSKTLDVTNHSIYDGDGVQGLSLTGHNATLGIHPAGNGARVIRIYDDSDSTYVSLKAPTAVTTYNMILPAAQGGANTFLKNDGAGNLTWASAGSGSVTDVTASSPLASSGGATPNITIQTASASLAGALSAADWTTFNSKQAGPLTGDVTTSGAAATLATVNSNVGSFGSSTSIPSFTVNGKGLITAASSNAVIAPASTLTGTTLASNVVTSSLTSVGTQAAALNMGSHKVTNVTDPTSAQDAATKAYVDNTAAGINPAVAVQAATTAASDTSGFAYNNGVSGIGAFFTGTVNTPITIDGYTFTTLGQRLLVKNDTQSPSGAFNGVYYVTQVQTSILAPILTRALDYDQPSDINNTGAIPVINGTVNGTTQWVLSSLVTTVGTDPLTFTQFARNPTDYLLKANNLSDVASKSTAFNNLSPMTTGGDIIYGGASGTGTRLANGSSGQVLTSNGGTAAPSWNTFTNGFSFFASSQVTTDSTGITSTSFATFSNSPAMSVVASVTGKYKVYSSVPINANAATETNVKARIVNTSGAATLLYESDAILHGDAASFAPTVNLFVQSVYTLTSGNTYVFDIQGKVAAGSTILIAGSATPFYMFAELCG